MNADLVEVTWDIGKNSWQIRIEVGTEVIRRYCKAPKEADDETLIAASQQTAADEGYTVDQTKISLIR